ncbi:hypothetical protein QYF61_011109 [Mycteria americana]|uniref:PDZ domain-containing protein n=1 Tax=Mycteria americana TaxID=33587 RepID=A0AAN7N0D2_MYCAM|nr:hypothetical protein QYF61_011109 [Mycteria americana]
MDWPEGKNFRISPEEEVTRAEEAPILLNEKSGQCSVAVLIHGWWEMPCGGGCSNRSRATGSAEVENLVVKVCHVDAHVPKSCATEEHQNNQQVDLDWQHKGELFIAQWAHDPSGHQGRDATYRWARDQGVDLTMDTIAQVIHECETCAAIKQAKRLKPFSCRLGLNHDKGFQDVFIRALSILFKRGKEKCGKWVGGGMLGLFIRGIEENSRSRRDGLFHENECIVKINHVDLTDKTFAQAQDIFRQAMKFPSVILEVLPPYNREQYEKSAIAPLCFLDNEEGVQKTKIPPPVHPKPALKTINVSGASSLEAGVQATLQQARSPNLPRLGRKLSSPSLSPLMGFGNKKNAKKIKIDLKKGPEGLGFTVVTRDSSVHGPGPIFVKNILPKGAAVKDGRLQSGDRILEVNGRDITGRTQEELVAMLRSTKQGETVCLVVARQEEAFLPRELDSGYDALEHSAALESVPVLRRRGRRPASYSHRCPNAATARARPGGCGLLIHVTETTEQLTFEIPLNDSGSAGLGVSLKGNKSRETGADLGIFIKSVIHGGAAFKVNCKSTDVLSQDSGVLCGRVCHKESELVETFGEIWMLQEMGKGEKAKGVRDGRLRVNDQLVAVNGESLLGKSNHEAMETLRRSMSMEGNIRGRIQLVVLRRLEVQTESCQCLIVAMVKTKPLHLSHHIPFCQSLPKDIQHDEQKNHRIGVQEESSETLQNTKLSMNQVSLQIWEDITSRSELQLVFKVADESKVGLLAGHKSVAN